MTRFFSKRIFATSLAAMAFVASPAAARAAEAAPATPPVLAIPEAAKARAGFDVERATEAYMALISPEARARSDAYFEGGYVLDFVGTLWVLGVAALLLGGGRASRVRDAVRARVRWRLPGDFLIAAVLLAAATILTLPYAIWVGWYREQAYGMSNETLAAFLVDWTKELGLEVIFSPILIALLYAVVRRAPRSWWLLGAGVTMLFLVVIVALGPVFIAPLFNDYQKLEAGPLRDEILSMARSHRIPADDVWWFDASKQTKRISANVSGFAGTMRISLNDNLLRRSPEESVIAVLGHEVGHYVLDHVVELLVELTLVIVAGFAFVQFTFAAVAKRFPRWRLEGIADSAGLPLVNALLVVFMTLLTPVNNSIIRSNEAEADAFGLAASRQPDGFAFAAVQLSEYRKMRPGRLEELVFYDHPSGYDRIHRSMAWKAEHLEEMAAREAQAAQGATP
jgi:STE24 endopeptidase